ncbi:MAG: helix-turn-helix transcriptional regulator [Saprospiraceae bacterium]|nr:helix-turn-helix transcriptional regulator [Saprospiraceae bacterium]
MIEIGHKIRKARLLKGYNQEYIASKLGISQEAYSKIESNKSNISYSRLDTISQLLDITIEEILNIDEKGPIFNNIADQQHHFAFNNGIENERKLYEHIITEKDKRIELLEKMLNQNIT